MQDNETATSFWKRFLKATDRADDFKYFECFHFDANKASADKLLRLVLKGKKTATSSSLLAYKGDNSPLPKVGDCSIVTDWDGVPHCVIETTRVTILPFREMTYDICKREGEDDTLESWQKGHIAFFTEDGKASGYTFGWDMPVVFEDFKVVYTE